jgi:sec-independent protein translocase protein TatC
VFELPLALAFLARIGIATPEFLRQKRRYAIMAILIVSAVITPPDVMSQLLMAAPLLLLYEISIIVARLTYRPSALFAS